MFYPRANRDRLMLTIATRLNTLVPRVKGGRLHYLNCTPLWAADNAVKGNRYAEEPLPQPAARAQAETPTNKLTDDDITNLFTSLGL